MRRGRRRRRGAGKNVVVAEGAAVPRLVGAADDLRAREGAGEEVVGRADERLLAARVGA